MDGFEEKMKPANEDNGRPVDCRVFEDQLDALVRGTLPDEGRRHLLLHADACPDCAIQLRVQEHLVRPSLEELESRVPQAFLEGIWEDVRAGIQPSSDRPDVSAETSRDGNPQSAGGVADTQTDTDTQPIPLPNPGAGRTAGLPPGPMPLPPASASVPAMPRPRRGVGWLIPTLAAASMALLASTGFLLTETHRLAGKTARLAQQVEEQQGWLAQAALRSGVDPVVRTAALAGRSPFARALSRQDEISLSGLRRLLGRMPGDRMVLTRAQVDDVLRSRGASSLPLLREALLGIGSTDGVRAGALLAALEALDVSPETTVPTARIIELLS